jgi:hypothetical protein
MRTRLTFKQMMNSIEPESDRVDKMMQALILSQMSSCTNQFRKAVQKRLKYMREHLKSGDTKSFDHQYDTVVANALSGCKEYQKVKNTKCHVSAASQLKATVCDEVHPLIARWIRKNHHKFYNIAVLCVPKGRRPKVQHLFGGLHIVHSSRGQVVMAMKNDTQTSIKRHVKEWLQGILSSSKRKIRTTLKTFFWYIKYAMRTIGLKFVFLAMLCAAVHLSILFFGPSLAGLEIPGVTILEKYLGVPLSKSIDQARALLNMFGYDVEFNYFSKLSGTYKGVSIAMLQLWARLIEISRPFAKWLL